LGQKYLTHVGNLETQKVNEVDESSYGRLFEIFLNLKLNWYLRYTFCFILIWMVYLGWAFGLLFLFLTVIVALMMMIYKELSSQQDKDRFVVLLLSL
jgi:POT family proton-dependent oligopeptide transporter